MATKKIKWFQKDGTLLHPETEVSQVVGMPNLQNLVTTNTPQTIAATKTFSLGTDKNVHTEIKILPINSSSVNRAYGIDIETNGAISTYGSGTIGHTFSDGKHYYYAFPQKSGTIALLEDLSAASLPLIVDYISTSWDTTVVAELRDKNKKIIAEWIKSAPNYGQLYLKYTDSNTNMVYYYPFVSAREFNSNYTVRFDLLHERHDITYNPSADTYVFVNSDIEDIDVSKYLPLEGGTLTGNLTLPNLSSIKFTASAHNASPTRVATFSSNDAKNGLAYSTIEEAMPKRLKPDSGNAVSDPNSITASGFYYISGDTTHRPPFKQVEGNASTDYRIINNMTANSGTWQWQLAMDLRSNDLFARRNQNGTWKDWTAYVKMPQGAKGDALCPPTDTVAVFDNERNATIKSSGVKITDLATTSYVDTKVANIVNSAPETLDTLNELATALGNDPNFATTVATQIGGKVSKAGDTMTGNLKVGSATIQTNGYIIGTWLQTTSASTHLSSTATKVAVIDASGWIYHRTPSELLTDMGGASTSYVDTKIEEMGVPDLSGYLPKTGGSLSGPLDLHTLKATQIELGVEGAGTKLVNGEIQVSDGEKFGRYELPSPIFFPDGGTFALREQLPKVSSVTPNSGLHITTVDRNGVVEYIVIGDAVTTEHQGMMTSDDKKNLDNLVEKFGSAGSIPDVSKYLPLAGGTMTGRLIINKAGTGQSDSAAGHIALQKNKTEYAHIRLTASNSNLAIESKGGIILYGGSNDTGASFSSTNYVSIYSGSVRGNGTVDISGFRNLGLSGTINHGSATLTLPSTTGTLELSPLVIEYISPTWDTNTIAQLRAKNKAIMAEWVQSSPNYRQLYLKYTDTSTNMVYNYPFIVEKDLNATYSASFDLPNESYQVSYSRTAGTYTFTSGKEKEGASVDFDSGKIQLLAEDTGLFPLPEIGQKWLYFVDVIGIGKDNDNHGVLDFDFSGGDTQMVTPYYSNSTFGYGTPQGRMTFFITRTSSKEIEFVYDGNKNKFVADMSYGNNSIVYIDMGNSSEELVLSWYIIKIG